MTEQAEILQRLTKVISQVLGEENLALTPETTAEDVPGWDSLTHVSLIVAIEREFKIRFTSGEITKLENVGALRRLVESKLAAASA